MANKKTEDFSKLPNIKDLKIYSDFMDERNLSLIEIETKEVKFKLEKYSYKNIVEKTDFNQIPNKNDSTNISKSEVNEITSGHIIKSPMVGTAYLAPDPNSDNFVKVGDKVIIGQTLLIVEAMKLMNNISSDKNGVVEKILVKNSQPVEFDQELILIK